MIARIAAALAMALAASALAAPALARDAPIRIWGPPAMRGIAERWADGYRRTHPDARFELTMKGSDTAIPGLYGGVADIALMGRPDDVVDDNGFARTLQHDVTGIVVANGAVAAAGKSDAIAILAGVRNPVAALTLAQLARIVDCGGAADTIATWGGVGADGAWRARPIHVYAYDFAGRTGAFFQHVVTHDGRRMCWDHIHEYADAYRLDGTRATAAERAGEAARGDPDALVIANAAEAHDGLKLVGIVGANGTTTFPTAEAIVAGRYPLSRRGYAFVDRVPGKPLDRRLAAFLDWVLSPAGQGTLAADDGYLALSPADASAQRAIVEAR